MLGASGYLGRHICAAFDAAGAEVIRVARRDGAAGRRTPRPRRRRLRRTRPPVHRVRGAGRGERRGRGLAG
ncbi:NAD-dependent epimerase/dehydratase family protein [Actinomadura madurae]|uniref:NAD-dependent epimerase/dehydratase family protein n=1 Tax=Actinomadura madurae TaxID=1993 RepID=UPI0020D21EEA|nr:NAD-dependent epimerase/dehydratase family protein [Actinomadura madurae]